MNVQADLGKAALVERAREIAPVIAAQSAIAQTQRDIPLASAMAMKEAGLFRLYQPSEWGGYECWPDTFMDVQDIFAEICLSHAWVQSVLAVQPLVVAQFEREAQADVWGMDPTAVVASATTPLGKAVPAPGGYHIAGRWKFSSGSSVADWVTVGAMTVADGSSAPEMRFFLVPKRDYQILDVWHTFGLRGTGSNDIVVENVFVPRHRTHAPSMGILNFSTAERPANPLYRLPWLPFFPLAIGNLAIGAGRGALRRFYQVVGGQPEKFRDNKAAAEIGPTLKTEIAQIDMATRAGVQRYIDHVRSDTIISQEDALQFRGHTSSILSRITKLVEDMTLIVGGRLAMETEPLTRIWLDLCAARLHPGNNPSTTKPDLGKGRMLQPGETTQTLPK